MLSLVLSCSLAIAAADDEAKARAALAETSGVPELAVKPVEPAPDLVPKEPAPAPRVQVGDDARVKRFLGALAGGAVGFGAAMAFMPLGDLSCFPGGGACFNTIHGLAAALAPFLAMGGAWLGYELLGGDGGLLVPSFSLAPAAVLTLALLGIGAMNGATTLAQLVPYLAGSVAFLLGLTAYMLDWRQAKVEALGSLKRAGSASVGRVAAEVALSGIVAVAGSIFTAFVAAMCRSTECAVAAGALGVASAASTALAAWGVHGALDGRGSIGAAFLGLGAAALTSLVAVPLYIAVAGRSGFFFSPIFSTESAIVVSTAVLGSVLFLPALFLEHSHTESVGEADDVKWTVGAAPMPGGGMLSAGARF